MTRFQAIDLASKMCEETGKPHVVRNTGGWGQPKYMVIAADAKNQPGVLVWKPLSGKQDNGEPWFLGTVDLGEKDDG